MEGLMRESKGLFASGGRTRSAGARRIGEGFDALPKTLLDLPSPSPDDQGCDPGPGVVYGKR